MIKIWVVCTMLLGYPTPVTNNVTFDNESGCQLFLHTKFDQRIQDALKLECAQVGQKGDRE